MSDPIADAYEALKDKYERSLASFENLRKRMNLDIDKARDQGRADAVRQMLPIVDDIERAVAAGASPEFRFDQAAAQAGISAIAGKARATLASMDVLPFESVGGAFRAELMEAIAKVSTRALAPGDVAVEITRGYRMRDKLLRPAQVAVAAADEE